MVCQSNLRQWGTFMAVSVTDNDRAVLFPELGEVQGGSAAP